MKSRERSNHVRVMHLWDWDEALKAVPYLHSVIGSLREHWLEVQSAQRQLERAAQEHGPSKREQLLEAEKQQDDLQRAQGKFDDALEELNRVDAFLVDPVKGLALMPFRKEDDLAWYVFDHFTPIGLIGWRYPNDPMEQCRPLSALPNPTAGDAVAS